MFIDVTSSLRLYGLLEEKFGPRFKCDPLCIINGELVGTLDKEKIFISFCPNDYLLVATSKKNLDELLPILKETMGNVEPICSYDLEPEEAVENTLISVIEWKIKNPDIRLKDIVNGRVYTDELKTKIHNITLYNSKKIEDYLESEQEREEKNKNAKIYGIYPGNLIDVDEVNNFNEVDLYFSIAYLNEYINRYRFEMFEEATPEVDLTDEQYALEYMIYQTTKFGVELPEPTIDKHIEVTPSYEAWYNFYANHFNNVLTNEQWDAFCAAEDAGQDTSAYMPSGRWNDSLEKTKQKILNPKKDSQSSEN